MLCWDYRAQYWEKLQLHPYFFDNYGRTLDQSQYKILNIMISVSPKLELNKNKVINTTLTIPKSTFEIAIGLPREKISELEKHFDVMTAILPSQSMFVARIASIINLNNKATLEKLLDFTSEKNTEKMSFSR